MADADWHYHATLDCGCKTRFNLTENVFLRQMEEDPEAVVVVHLYCDKCARMGHTHNLAVTTADTRCYECLVAGRTLRKGKVAPWKP